MSTHPSSLVLGSILFQVASAIILMAGVIGLFLTRELLGFFGFILMIGVVLMICSFAFNRYAKTRIENLNDEE